MQRCKCLERSWLKRNRKNLGYSMNDAHPTLKREAANGANIINSKLSAATLVYYL